MSKNRNELTIVSAAKSNVSDAAYVNGERIEAFNSPIRVGSFWRVKTAARQFSLKAGHVVPIVRTRDINGLLHQVHVALHPSTLNEDGTVIYLAGEFLKDFEPVPDDEAAEIRRRERDEVVGVIEAAQAQLASPPAPPARAAISFDAVQKTSGDGATGKLDLTSARKSMMRAANEAQVYSKVLTKHVEKNTEIISQATKTLAAFQQERARLVMAAAEDALAYAKFMTQGAETTKLFAGVGVDVRRLCEGEPAPFGPLNVFQRMLFLDEEFMVHLSKGGADWKDVDKFEDILASDSKLRDRLLPTPRSVVALCIRRDKKDRLSEKIANIRGLKGVDPLELAMNILGTAQEAAKEEELDRRVFLLARNGENITSIEAPLATYEGDSEFPRLFPTVAQMEAIFEESDFRGGKKRLTLEHIEMADAVDELEKMKRHYKRLLVMLWGAHSRDPKLFGDFYDVQACGSWLSPEFQSSAIRLIHDDEGVLRQNRPGFKEYVATVNANIVAGSRVVCNWEALTAEHTRAPGMYSGALQRRASGDHWRSRHSYPVKDYTIATVAFEKGLPVVLCPAVNRGLLDDSPRRNFDTRVFFAGPSGKNMSGFGEIPGYKTRCMFLCIDSMTAADLDFYIESRLERRSYLEYFEMFEMARTILVSEEAALAPIIEKIAADLAASRRWDRARCDEAGALGLRRWRAKNDWAMPIESAKFFAEMREICWNEIATEGAEEIFQAAEKNFAAEGRTLLRWSADGRRRYAYVEPTVDERAQLGVLAEKAFWTLRLDCDVQGREKAARTRKWVSLLGVPAGETVIGESPLAAPWVASAPPRNASRDDVARIVAALPNWRQSMKEVFGPIDNVIDATEEDLNLYQRDWSRGKYVAFPEFLIYVGALYRPSRNLLSPLALQIQIDNRRYVQAPPAQREAVLQQFASMYRDPTFYMEGKLRKHTAKNTLDNFGLRLSCIASRTDMRWLPGMTHMHGDKDGDFSVNPLDLKKGYEMILAPDCEVWVKKLSTTVVPSGGNWADILALAIKETFPE